MRRLLVAAAMAAVVSVIGSALAAAPSQAALGGPTGDVPPSGTVLTAPRPVPAKSGTGRRVVYMQSEPQYVWLIDSRERVVREFPVSGRTDWPLPGTYAVFSKSPSSYNAPLNVSFTHMVRFVWGHTSAIGFHSIPRSLSTGKPVHSEADLGKAVGVGGCPHLSDADAEFLYGWARMGTTVVVLRK